MTDLFKLSEATDYGQFAVCAHCYRDSGHAAPQGYNPIYPYLEDNMVYKLANLIEI